MAAASGVTPSDQALIARVLAHEDRAAFGELVRRHQSAVRALLRRVTGGQHALADDLAQETFLTAHRALGRYRGEAAFSTWLLGIACHRWREHRRRQRDTVAWSEATTPDASPRLDGLDTATPAGTRTADLQQDLAAALHRLAPEERAAVHLCYTEGLSHAEAARALGSPLGTVKTHVARAKAKLRRWLQPWAPA